MSPKPLELNGKTLQKAVVPLAQRLGWKVAFFPPVKTASGGWRVGVGGDAKGWPDLIMVRDRPLVVEIKGDGDRLRGHQQTEWLLAFRVAGVEATIWTPQDWYDGVIEETLRRRGPSPPRPAPETQLALGVTV